MSNVKGMPGYYPPCEQHVERPFRGTISGRVRLLAKSPRHQTASFFIGNRRLEIKAQALPDWFKDGALIEFEVSDQTTIRLILAAKDTVQ